MPPRFAARLTAIAFAGCAPLLLTACFPNQVPVKPLPTVAEIPVSEHVDSVELSIFATPAQMRSQLGQLVVRLGQPQHMLVRLQPHGDDVVAAAAAKQAGTVMHDLGILPSNLAISPPVEGAAGTLVVTASRMVASAPNCPSMARQSFTTTPSERPIFAFGCANLSNLAEMIDDPRDLIDPAPYAGPRGVTEVDAIRRFNDNKTTPLNVSTTQSK
ncbi:MAG TPA: CpaD family pilus assembly lipoprotein [Patescibacteria group bacterium]|nr:CpaD family pilus assembly lipoprotein [Patescibacteria group bacterium]